MIVVVVVAILIVIAAPDGDTEATEQGRNACKRFEADVDYARSRCLARPDDPVVIKVDGDNNRYWLARASDPDTPIMHPQSGNPYIVIFGPNGQEGLRRVQLVAIDFDGDDVLGFDAFGSTDQQTPAILQLRSGGAEYELEVAPITGSAATREGYNTDFEDDYGFKFDDDDDVGDDIDIGADPPDMPGGMGVPIT